MASKVIMYVVDDEEMVHDVLKIKFRKSIKDEELEMYNFLSASEYLEFLQKFEANGKPQFLITDINMPVMDGIEMSLNVSQHYPQINIYFATAYTCEEYEERIKSIPYKGLMTKPIKLGDITTIVEKMADGVTPTLFL